MALIRAALIVLMLSGCALQEQRQLLYAPEPLNTPTSKTAFSDAYAKALAEAQTSSAGHSVERYVDAGNAANTRACVDWLGRVTLARRGIVASDRNIGVAAGLVTALLGIFGASTEAVAVLGAGVAAAHGFGTNLQADVLGAPSQYQAQAAILSLLGQCSDQLTIDAPLLKFSQAYQRLEACHSICSFEAATEAANQALSGTTITVSPSGAMRVQK